MCIIIFLSKLLISFAPIKILLNLLSVSNILKCSLILSLFSILKLSSLIISFSLLSSIFSLFNSLYFNSFFSLFWLLIKSLISWEKLSSVLFETITIFSLLSLLFLIFEKICLNYDFYYNYVWRFINFRKKINFLLIN